MPKTLAIDVAALGLHGPGLQDWAEAVPILRGEAAYRPSPLAKPVAEGLTPRERRRHTFTIALAVATALQAARLKDGRPEHGEFPAVFACSGGDTDVIHRICAVLDQPGHPVSPQQFMNSVHNAPVGYWSIAAGCRASTTSLSAFDASFAAGLLEAAVQIAAGQPRVLLVAYDAPAPMPIWPFRPLTAPFAAALMLTAPGVGGEPLAALDLALANGTEETQIDQPELEKLRLGNPAARSLSLLQVLARREPARIVLPYLAPATLGVGVRPC